MSLQNEQKLQLEILNFILDPDKILYNQSLETMLKTSPDNKQY